MKTEAEIVKALRCVSSKEIVCRKEACPYFYRDEEAKAMMGGYYSDDFFDGCRCDDIDTDAADLIEKLVDQREWLRDLVEKFMGGMDTDCHASVRTGS